VIQTIKAIVFDMDGVLVDAREWHFLALNKALSLFGMSIARYDHLSTFDGLPTKKKLELLALTDHIPTELQPFISELKQKYTNDFIYQECRPNFTRQYALSRLKEEGYPIAVASNSIRNTVDAMLERSGLNTFIDFSLSNNDVSRPKPDPEIYQLAISRLECSASEVLVVEDNEHGVKAAESAGAHILHIEDISQVNYKWIRDRIDLIDIGKAW
jgi:HAD superfamily hydrolase (TIGR01509 family)